MRNSIAALTVLVGVAVPTAALAADPAEDYGYERHGSYERSYEPRGYDRRADADEPYEERVIVERAPVPVRRIYIEEPPAPIFLGPRIGYRAWGPGPRYYGPRRAYYGHRRW